MIPALGSLLATAPNDRAPRAGPARWTSCRTFPALRAHVTELAEAGRNNRQIADILNAEGFRPPKRTSTNHLNPTGTSSS